MLKEVHKMCLSKVHLTLSFPLLFFLCTVPVLKEITFMNGDLLYLDLQVLYMKEAFSSWISHFHLTIHSSHQR